ncbi:MAG: RNA polymerase sigma factor [Steroidobacteraceae bacterium]
MPERRGSQRIGEWARNWNAGLTRFLRRRLPQQIDAEDLAQEVYVRLLRIEKLDLIEEPQAYLYRVASNVASEWRMRACHSKPHSADELDTLVAATTPEALLDETDFARQLDAALRGMTPMIRTIIYLKLRDGMSHEEIARHLGITTRMVRRLLTTGYAHLRSTIDVY